MRIVEYIIVGCLVSCVWIKAYTEKPAPVKIVKVEVRSKINWNKLTEAIIQVESEGNPRAINRKTNAVGVLQQTPIYVKEVNRILGKKKYSLNDRYNKTKAIEMFNIYQSYYNPDKDLHLALKLHNPRSKYSYHKKVVNVYKELTK